MSGAVSTPSPSTSPMTPSTAAACAQPGMSSVMRAPWPIRCAWHTSSASWIESTPSASPAWIVTGNPARCSRSNASRCAAGGNPFSGPAMSKPTAPASRWRSASCAISVDRSACRIAVTSCPARIDRPASAAIRVPSSIPACTASTAWSRVSPFRRCCSGAQRASATTTPSATWSSTHSRATRVSAGAVCMTASVWSNVSR